MSSTGQGEYDDVTRDGLQIRQTAEQYSKDNQSKHTSIFVVLRGTELKLSTGVGDGPQRFMSNFSK